MKLRLFYCAALASAGLAFLPAAVQAVPPSNDNFANRMTLTGQAVSSAPVVINEATREGLERSDTYNQTVWYSWTAPQDGIVTITTAGTTYYNQLSVFNGTSLPTLVAINESLNSTASLTFFSKGGFAYQICIGAYDSRVTGTAVLNIVNKPTTITAPTVIGALAGSNDNFANAVALPGAPVSGFTYPLETSREGQEPTYTYNRTVWWTWTAPADAVVTMNTSGSSYYNALTVFNGTSLTSLSLVGNDLGDIATVIFPAKAGATYSICVGSYNSNAGVNSVLNITTAPLGITSPSVIGVLPGSANDNFANAVALTGPVVSSFAYNGDATRETLERAGTGDQTLWWTWTAPADAQVTMNTAASDFDTVLTVYNGDALSSLKLVDNAYTSLTFPAKTGAVYRISIGNRSSNGNAGSPVLNISTAPLGITSPVVVGSTAAANDNFASAQSLGSAPAVSGFGYSYDATVEQLESTKYGSHTLWWTWTAPKDGNLTASTAGTDYSHYLTAATGDNLAALTTGTPGQGDPNRPTGGTFTVTGGMTYHFVIGSVGNSVGTAVLNLSFAAGLNHVSVSTDTPVVHPSESRLAVYRITRDGDPSKEVVVNYTLKGTNAYINRSINGTKKMKAGKSSVKLNVNINGYGNDFNQAKLNLTIKPGDGYVVGDPAKAKVKVAGD